MTELELLTDVRDLLLGLLAVAVPALWLWSFRLGYDLARGD